MKLASLENTYEASTPIQVDSEVTDRPKIKLFYRGNTFDYTPRPASVSEELETEGSTVTLIYRGNTYERKLQSPKAYQKPRAINWRWQFE
jgi:Domain of unknown function (DUF4278)